MVRAAAETEASQLAAIPASREATIASLKSNIGGWVRTSRPPAAASGAGPAARRGHRDRALARRPLLDPELHRDVRVRWQLRRRQSLERGRGRLPDPPLDLAALRRPASAERVEAEQGRIAAQIWADSGAGAWVCAGSTRRSALPDRLSSSAAPQQASSGPSRAARPPFLSLTWEPVTRATALEKSGSWPTSITSPRPAASLERSKSPPRELVRPPRSGAERFAGELRGVLGPHLRTGQADVELDPQRPSALPASRDWRSPFSVSSRSASGLPSPSSASPCRSSQITPETYPLRMHRKMRVRVP